MRDPFETRWSPNRPSSSPERLARNRRRPSLRTPTADQKRKRLRSKLKSQVESFSCFLPLVHYPSVQRRDCAPLVDHQRDTNAQRDLQRRSGVDLVNSDFAGHQINATAPLKVPLGVSIPLVINQGGAVTAL